MRCPRRRTTRRCVGLGSPSLGAEGRKIDTKDNEFLHKVYDKGRAAARVEILRWLGAAPGADTLGEVFRGTAH